MDKTKAFHVFRYNYYICKVGFIRPLSRRHSRRRRIFFPVSRRRRKKIRLADRRRICASAAAAEKYSAKPTVFLKEFEIFTDLVSSAGPTLSLMSLMELMIMKMCKILPNDDKWLKAVKNKGCSECLSQIGV